MIMTMTVSLFTDRRMLDHRVPARHPERPERLQAVLRHLERTGYWSSCPKGVVVQASDAELVWLHSPQYLARVAQLEAAGGGMLDPDTWVFPGSVAAARLAAGAAACAVASVLSGEHQRALCLVRPPGHHALPSSGMGFCIYSNVSVAAELALRRFDVNRALIVDFDVHHGNGTQEMFYESSRVGFLSIHRYPFYPGTGGRSETGHAAGLGGTRNIPLPYGTSRADYRAAFRAGLEALADRIRPELVLISAGFDAHAEDPVGDLGLDVEDFEVITKEIVAVAECHSGGRVVSLLEGGYNVPILAGSVVAHLAGLGAVPNRAQAAPSDRNAPNDPDGI
jgi:acetoin utilization deacetylase AcuC-like enzyme